jgi:hypothetical protein
MIPSRRNWIQACCLYVASFPIGYPLIYLYEYLNQNRFLDNGYLDLGYYVFSILICLFYFACYFSLSLKPQKKHFQQSAFLLLGCAVVSVIQSEFLYSVLLFVYYGFFYKLLETDLIEKNKRGRSRH